MIDRIVEHYLLLNVTENFQSVINPNKINTPITRIIELSKGKLIVQCIYKSSYDVINITIRQHTQSKITAKDDNKKHPTVILKSVDKTLSDDQITNGLLNQNTHLAQVNNKFKGPWTQPKVLFKRNTMSFIIRLHLR